MALSPDGKILATSGLGADVKLWSLPSGEPVGTLQGHQTAVGSLRFIQDGQYLVSLGYEQSIRFWEIERLRTERVIDLDVTGARSLLISPHETRAALSLEGKVQIWELERWEMEQELLVGTKAVGGLAFSPDGCWLAVGAADRKIRVWETGWR